MLITMATTMTIQGIVMSSRYRIMAARAVMAIAPFVLYITPKSAANTIKTPVKRMFLPVSSSGRAMGLLPLGVIIQVLDTPVCVPLVVVRSAVIDIW